VGSLGKAKPVVYDRRRTDDGIEDVTRRRKMTDTRQQVRQSQGFRLHAALAAAFALAEGAVGKLPATREPS